MRRIYRMMWMEIPMLLILGKYRRVQKPYRNIYIRFYVMNFFYSICDIAEENFFVRRFFVAPLLKIFQPI